MNPISVPFTQVAVRHLYWAVFSPELAVLPSTPALQVEYTPKIAAWLTELDANPSSLLHFLSVNEHQLLGSYFEVLWQFFLTYAPNWTLLRSGIQIQDDNAKKKGATLGELDILCKTPNATAIHLELAVKFFLLKPNCDGRDPSHWIGPQTRDRLDLKTNKLSEKQFPFYFHPQTQQHLRRIGLPVDAEQRLSMKGYLFRHILQVPTTGAPPTANTHVTMAHWCRVDELIKLKESNQHWCIIEKPQWLGNYRSTETPLDFAQASEIINQHFNSTNHENKDPTDPRHTQSVPPKHKHHRMLRPPYAIMLVAMKPYNDAWYETQRFMVVHRQWPCAYDGTNTQ